MATATPPRPQAAPSSPRTGNRRLGLAATMTIGAFASCTAEATSFPFDLAKTRLQVQGMGAKTIDKPLGMWAMLRKVASDPVLGSRALFTGLSPALLRQATYGTMKLVLYEQFKNYFEDRRRSDVRESKALAESEKGEGASGPQKHTSRLFTSFTAASHTIVAGALAGALSAAACTPTDLIKVRLQAGTHHYSSLFEAFTTIARQEHVWGLYKGVGPTTFRATLVAVLNFPMYDLAKETLLHAHLWGSGYKFRDDVTSHLLASFCSAVVSTYITQPIDVVKSRMMDQPIDHQGRGTLYRSSLQCCVRTAREEGLSALWKGSVPSLCRNAPWLVVFWCTYEYMKHSALVIEDLRLSTKK